MVGKNIIFIGGIHGVGKSTFAKSLAKKYDISYYSSSDLIAVEKGERFKNKSTKNINSNQDLLIDAIRKTCIEDRTYILDGHFCLLDTNNDIKKIPIETYKEIEIKSIIVLVEDVEKIAERLKTRDNTNYDLKLIEYFQQEEKNYAKKVSLELNIPIKFIKSTCGKEIELEGVN